VTVGRVGQKVKSQPCLKGKVTGLRKMVLYFGFRWHRTKDSRETLMELHAVRTLRVNYLRKLNTEEESALSTQT
jgi:hypothetical protein